MVHLPKYMNLMAASVGGHPVPSLALRGAALCAALALIAGCHPDMWNQPKYTALQQSDFSESGGAALATVTGTVPYDGKRRDWTSPVFEANTGERSIPSVLDTDFYTGRTEEGFVAENYFEITTELIERGRQRYEITCTPCHGMLGDGTGVITQRQRGFPAPPSYHLDRLREVEDGYIFDVMTNGFGRMYSYYARVQPEDRWAIVAYIRALQYSRNADMAVLTEEEQDRLLHPENYETTEEVEGGEEHAH